MGNQCSGENNPDQADNQLEPSIPSPETKQMISTDFALPIANPPDYLTKETIDKLDQYGPYLYQLNT